MLEMSSKGLYAVRFPRRHPCPRSGLGHGELWIRGNFKDLRAKPNCFKLDLSGLTPFQKKVYSVLRQVPPGEVITYGELAKRAGYPGAARAVGSAMKRNRLPLVIPCHRVIPASGGFGEYSAGKGWKKMLLEMEKE